MAWIEVVEEEDAYLSCDVMSFTEQEHAKAIPTDVEDEHKDHPDTDDEAQPCHEPRTMTEKRRAQNEIMKAFAAEISAKSSRQDIENAITQSVKQEHMSVRDIMANHATTTRITNPRDYQTELFQRAKDENTIAVLDTGTGKTHIATLLLRHVLDEELEHRSRGDPHRVAFFLVDSVNLVFQQANVLRCGLDQSVEAICGSMGSSLWNENTWAKHFDKHMVIVCTAQVLIECMMHSFLAMARINVLIFDEAHHAKGNHPYARVMKDYYVKEQDTSKRPRIFGMTASPVDVRGQTVYHVQDAARELERLLHAKIATATESMLASNNITKPEEQYVLYAPLCNKFETALQKELKEKYGDIGSFSKFFKNAQVHAVELGRWASDAYWTFAFAEDQARKLQIREEYRFNKSLEEGQVDVINAKLKHLEEAAISVQGFDPGKPTLSLEDLSSKVLKLHEWLSSYYERTGDSLCLVFVKKRQTARLLKLLFEQIGVRNLRCDLLVGVSAVAGECNVTLRSQILTLQKFRRGELNCLFVTSVAEEGLDIPQCNLVIRFDLYRTMIEYVQSRGRARYQNSKYLHMVEENNYAHIGSVLEARKDEETMREFCSKLAHDRNLMDADDHSSILDVDDGLYPSYTDPGSGARLTYRSSLAILNHFVAVWPAPNNENMWQPTYTISPSTDTNSLDSIRGGFVCEVILPEHLPLITMVGEVHSRKIFAKCSAAFKMCLELRKKEFLSPNLLPTMQKYLPAQRNALLAVSEKRKGRYQMLIKPNFWARERGVYPKVLYMTIVDVVPGLERKHQPLGLLTRVPFPQLPSFPIYHTNGRASNISSSANVTPFALAPELLEMITKFTLQIFLDVYNKEYENDIAKMSYWIVPLQRANSNAPIQSLLDMEQIAKVVQNPSQTWTAEMSPKDLLNRYLVDPFHGGRRYFSERIATEKCPQDSVPANIARQGHRFMDTILDYTDSKWSRTRDTSKWNPDQPVLEVEKVPFRRNHLANVEDKEKKEIENLKAFVCPQPLRISNMNTDFVAMCYVLPAAIHRYESYLIALDACKVLDLSITPALALEALTKDSENSGEYDEDKINFKSGMGPNYERLEFLGDCFLKMATSISVFVQQPDENEFEFHVRRMVMLCNQNLMETAIGIKKVALANGSEVDLELTKYIRTEAFSRRTWYPEGLKLLKGKGAGKSDSGWLNLTHNLGDKSVADVCEAFIGAAFMEYHRPGSWSPSNWDEAVKAVKLFANSPDHSMSKWSDYYAAYVKPKYQIAEATASVLDLARKVEAVHPYHFKYPRVLRSAFVHPSQPFMWEQIPNYQRLEFLGDSLLDVAFILYLFYKYPDKDPHWLTEHKTPMVSNRFLSAVCVKLGWHTHLKQNNSLLTTQIKDYVYEVEEAEREANGAVDYWVSISEPPKCLADIIEAYVAAMFVDSEFDFNVVQNFFDMHLKPFFVDMTLAAYESLSSGHPITRLSRLLTTNFGCREWCMGALATDTIIPGKGKALAAMFLIHNKVHFHDLGTSGRYARERCSKKALQALDGIPPYEYRKKYGCNCIEEGSMEGVQNEVADKETEERIKAAMGPNI